MNRHYDGEILKNVLTKLRALKREDGVKLNIGADLIVGFPGETDGDYQDTEDIIRDFQITQLHAFPFSAHMDHYSVPAGSFRDQVPNHIAQSRLKKLQKAGEEVFETFARENIGKELRVLVEKCPTILLSDHPTIRPFSGWSENYLFCDETNFVPFPDQEIAKGKIVWGIYKAL